MSNNIWKNGEAVNKHITEFSSKLDEESSLTTLTCKETTVLGGTGSDNDSNYYRNYKRKPYPSPNPSHYAVVEAPGINRNVMRGCFTTSAEKGVALWNQDLVVDGITYNDEKIEICDNYKGSFCASPHRKEACKNDAPGGLADFTHPMPVHGKEFLKNGFIIDRCECQLDTDKLKSSAFNLFDEEPSKYTCWDEKRFRSDYVELWPWPSKGIYKECCYPNSHSDCMNKGYTIANREYKQRKSVNATDGTVSYYDDDDDSAGLKTFSLGVGGEPQDACNDFHFPGSDWEVYQPSELWDGRGDRGSCDYWYNPSLDDLPQDKKDKNNCTQYLMKWAKSCEWCKKTTPFPSGDALRLCTGTNSNHRNSRSCPLNNRECAGECTDSLLTNEKTCTFFADIDCNLCDSDLWDYIPGGWEALVDPKHPKHEMAKFAYVPKLIKTSSDKAQPQTSFSPIESTFFGSTTRGRVPDTRNILNYEDQNVNSKLTTTFTGMGPFVDEEAFGGGGIGYKNNQPDVLFSLLDNRRAAEFTWVNNYDIGHDGKLRVVDNPHCSEDQSNPIDNNTNKTVWQNSSIENDNNMTNITQKLESCTFFSPTISDDESPSSHTMCERNQNLTGYGECDQETDYLAKLWLDGKWDMSKYTGNTELVDEGLSPEEIRKRRVEGMRCCLGLVPEYKTKENNYEIPQENYDKEHFNKCRPGLTCPSSKACKELFNDLFSGKWSPQEGGFDLYDFGRDYPEEYDLNGSSSLEEKDMTNSAYYAKAYCEMMSGGVSGSGPGLDGYGHDFDVEVDCRKFTYNYCTTPVRVDVQDPEGVGLDIKTKSIEYPLRVFTDTCYDWCREDKLSKSLPSQKGVCDMAMGKTCQQLQVDGWIDPNNWGNSRILKFADEEGNWVEESGTEGSPKIHRNLTLDRIKNVCGCFLLGSECGGGNCSVSYCGAGTTGAKGPGPVSMEQQSEDIVNYDDDNNVNYEIRDMGRVYNYQGGDPVAPKWVDNINNKDFSCYDNNNRDKQQCFTGCNYVNYNDTCWLASPSERLQDMVTIGNEDKIEGFHNINVWECEDRDMGDSCKTYNKKYGCFGTCSIDNYNVDGSVRGNCGTEEWFDHRMNLNPGEREYKIRKDFYESLPEDQRPSNVYANKSRNWTKWQNFYANWREIPTNIETRDSNSTITVPGWGSYNTDSDGRPRNFSTTNEHICFYPSCGNSRYSVKPYRYMRNAPNCGSECSISMQSVVNNQGAIVGGIVSSLNAGNSCNLGESSDWKADKLSSVNNLNYLSYMGTRDCSMALKSVQESGMDCSYCGLDSRESECSVCRELMDCTYGSEVCVNVETGDNCNLCTSPKPEICCVSPQENIQEQQANIDLLNQTSDHISYVCDKLCPPGTTNLKELEKKCGIPCSNRHDEFNCQSCEYCTWIPENKESAQIAHCASICPLPSTTGWGIANDKDTITYPPTTPTPPPPPTVNPRTSPPVTLPPSTSPPPVTPKWDGLVIIGLLGGLIGLVIVFGSIFYLLRSPRMRK